MHVGRRRATRSRTHVHENWQSWWTAAARDPELTDLFTERERRRPSDGNGGGGDNGLTATRHTELLRRAGFRHVAPVWQYGESQVLVAVKDRADQDQSLG